MNYNFQLETKLMTEAPELHTIFSDNVLCSQAMLNKYKAFFPTFTDHTVLHSLEVIDFCNELVGENIGLLNTDEIFVLLMSAYLHDSGMGITKKDYEEFSPDIPSVVEFCRNNPDADTVLIIRDFHNEFSGKYIEKHATLFDFPSEKHLFSVIQICRGHRKTDLFSAEEYPEEILLDNGNIIHLPYLTALIRLADEIDIASDRNIQFLFNFSDELDEISKIEFSKHKAIKTVNFTPTALVAQVDYSDEKSSKELDLLFEKLNNTLKECVDVIETRTPFKIFQKEIIIEKQ